MAKVLLLTAKSKTGFQSFVLAIRHWEMNPEQEAHLTPIKIDTLRELVEYKPCKSTRELALVLNTLNPQSAATWLR